MAKSKKKKSFNSESILAKKTTTQEKKLNPFEVHLNKEKFTILGRKCKHDRGLPGVSRAKAIKVRKRTIGREFQELHKVNKFRDKRFGRGNNINDDIATERFVIEKEAQFKTKKNIFNLNDEEVLTHRGQTLEEIEQFQDPASEDSEEELDAEFTEAVHFGGDIESADRKAAIEEKIAEAKRKKLEIAKEKDEVYELTTKLDENYKKLIPLMGKFTKGDGKRPPKDDYDRVLKEMIFEPRGEVSDKLQSDEELLKKEKERLEKLEKERLARMQGEECMEEKPKHKSADDLDDGYFAGSAGEEEEATLAYNLSANTENVENKGSLSDGEIDNISNEGKEKEDDFEESEDDEVDESEEDNFSDLKESDNEDENEYVEHNKKLHKSDNVESTDKNKQNGNSKIQAIKDLPFVYDMPATYDSLYDILYKQHPDYQHVIIERMIKCNHPKLDTRNREEMVKLFGFLLQYINDVFSNVNEHNIENSFMIFDRLSSHFFELSHMNPAKTSNCFLEVIKEKYNDYKNNQKLLPTMDFVIFFKLVSNMFSTSDFRHLIVTPCFIFMSHILSRAQVKNRCDISIGLFIVTILLEYTQISRRYIPATLNFLRGVIFLSILKRPIEIIKIVPPFSSTGNQINLLAPTGNIENENNEIMTSKDLVKNSIDDDFKVRALNTALKLLNDCFDTLKENIGTCFLVEPFVEVLGKLKIDQYPDFVKKSYENLNVTLEGIKDKRLKYLVAEEKKPKALRLMEPRIEKVYDDKRRPKLSKEKEMQAIMLHKVKRETRGAIREIRRDTGFLTQLQIKKQIQSDMERKEKVQRIYAEASAQQGELNALARKRKK